MWINGINGGDKMRENIRINRKRILAGVLAFTWICKVVLPFFDMTPSVSRAANFKGTNIWSGNAETMFGHSRNYLYKWSDGYQMTFCISPGKHMGSSVTSGAYRTTVDDTDIPFIRSTEDYELLADVCCWFDRHGSTQADNATYAAVQTAVWAVMNDGWESAETLEQIVDQHVPGTMKRWEELKGYIERKDSVHADMPGWLKTSRRDAQKEPQMMRREAEGWKLELDISAAPVLAVSTWQFEGGAEGWSSQVSEGKLVFTYTGGEVPDMVITTPVPDGLMKWHHNTETLNIYLPKDGGDRNQAMISGGIPPSMFYIGLSGDDTPPENPDEVPDEDPEDTEDEVELPVIYEHRETFTAHYQAGLEKLCAETGRSLQGAEFRVLEAFDADQAASLDRTRMTPRPAVWENYKVCGDAVTDADGMFIHKDVKKFEYVKTYCDGHPGMEYMEEDGQGSGPAGGTAGSGERGQLSAETQDSVKAQQEALVRMCAAYNAGNHFHAIEPGAAREKMLKDRDEAYELFIGLEYRYAFEETQARYGYVRHGRHPDDEDIPVLCVPSLESGKTAYRIGDFRDVIVNESAGYDDSWLDGREELADTGSANRISDVSDGIKGSGGILLRELLRENMRLKGGKAYGKPGTESATPSEPERRVPAETGIRAAEAATPSDASFSGNLRYRFSVSSLPQHMDDTVPDDPVGNLVLPEPVPDDVEPLAPRSYCTELKDDSRVTVLDRRTEGEIHLNKKDIDLADGEKNGYDSYGDSQGDATLEGAVYGLYAAEDIIHPDGKTGVVYRAGELTAVAATDKNGDASFMAYTENGDNPPAVQEETAAELSSWIGRPLIAGRYLVREVARSEGYEMAPGKDIQAAGRADVISAMRHPIDMHDGSWVEFEVACSNTIQGFDIFVSGFPEGSTFCLSRMEETSAGGKVVVDVQMVPTGEYERAGEGEYRLDENGSYVPKRDGQGNIIYNPDDPVMKTYYVTRRTADYPDGEYEITVDPGKWADRQAVDREYVCDETNAILAQLGYAAPDPARAAKAPWSVIELSGRSNQELSEGILEWFAQHSFWSMASVDEVWEENGNWKALAFHDYSGGSAVYEERTGLLYVKIQVRTAAGKRHMYVPYPAGDCTFRNGYASVAALKQAEGEIPEKAVMENYLEAEYHPFYEQYEEGEYRLDGKGERIPVYKEEYIYGTNTDITSDYELIPLAADYDPRSGSYRIHAANTIDWQHETGPVVLTFRAAAPGQSPPDHPDMFYSDYLTGVTGAGASAFPCTCGGRPDGLVELVYPGQISPMQDGAGKPGNGTRLTPVSVRETVIGQRVKVIKTLRMAGMPDDAEADGGKNLPNFRFKAYLKSNLERIYRNESGQIVWLDRRGREIDIVEAKKTYPALVPAIFTKVPRRTEKLYKQTAEAVTANKVLHPDDGTEARHEYTVVLETVEREMADGAGRRTVKVPNYEKFFDAITVANCDKWDNGEEQHTSHRPPGNLANRSEAAEANAETSDMVRQFAIDWYLDGEVALADRSVERAYGDQLYDEALQRAIRKANQYLLPFFKYDLDEIYAIKWDGEADGGADGDASTVSADQEGGEAYSGISSALPYGSYVIVEQQPRYAGLLDLPNRHYRIDSPKEVLVPSVYMQEEGGGSDDAMSERYIYNSSLPMDEMEKQYGIRFGTEQKGEDQAYVTEAHNQSGDFQIYPYGMDIGKIRNGPVMDAGEGDYFALTQDKWKPFLNYYNEKDDRQESGITSYYLSEGESGRGEIGKVYRYSSVSESAGTADGVKTMRGVLTAYEGLYAPMLVPWSLSGEDLGGDGSYARVRFANAPYRVKLRIEKMDRETGENLLHDDAIFNIYAAEREDSPDGEGKAVFYDKDTPVRTWRKQFLEDMRAADIRRLPDGRYEGVIPAGTPVCSISASDCAVFGSQDCVDGVRIFQTDTEGARKGVFHSYTTSRDGFLESAGQDFMGGYGQQNAGWLETPEPLEAGVYVLAEAKPPAGYVRSRPVAVEVYSDTVTYYRRGNKDGRAAATVYAADAGEGKEPEDSARIYVENAPTRLRVEKQKEAWAGMEGSALRTVTYRLSGRVDGSLAEIGGRSDYEYAYQNGVYMGYAWKKGTLEYLKALKDAGMDVRIVYHGGLFAGYGYITQPLETADDGNRYVPGALMTLYEGIELTPSGGGQDLAYHGLMVERRETGNVKRMYVKQGHAGFRTEFRNKKEEDALAGTDFWSAEKVMRGDTDILFYDLGGLELFQTRTAAGREVRYAYGRNHEALDVRQLEEDKEASPATDGSQSIFAFRGSRAVFELAGGNFMRISYSVSDKVMEGEFARPEKTSDKSIRMSEGVTLYHLDEDGNRDSLVDPYTGMAYALAGGDDAGTVRILVWPVIITRDNAGHLLAQEKIATSRIATVGGNPDNEYLTGTWRPEQGEQSHGMFSLMKNRQGQNMNGEPVLTGSTGELEKTMLPVYGRHGLVQYYRPSGESYETDTLLYDRDGRIVRNKPSALIDGYDSASYVMREDRSEAGAPDDRTGKVLHRSGESYILENTWVTGDISPDDPFSNRLTDGQADVLRRVPVGTYIMEELTAPDGYLKGFPAGVIVDETEEIQETSMTDRTTKVLIGKADGTDDYTYKVLDMRKLDRRNQPAVLGTVTEGKGVFSQKQIPGARLALYRKSEAFPADSRQDAEEEIPVVEWNSEQTPLYIEGIPAGEYLLKEHEAPPGMVNAPLLEITVGQTGQVQPFIMYDDHTKVEIEKYAEDKTGSRLVNGAEFTVYEAVTDVRGQVIYDEDGSPKYDPLKIADRFVSVDGDRYTGFIRGFEKQFELYGTKLRAVSWEHEGQIHTASYVSHEQIDASVSGGREGIFPTAVQMILRTEDGKDIRVTAYGQGESRNGSNWVYEYRFDYHALPEVNGRASSYLTETGMRRFDYLPVGAAYVAVETEPPAGYAAAEPVLLQIRDLADVQRYRIRNEENALLISKTFSGGDGRELPGAKLALYRAAPGGELIREESYLAAMWVSGQDGIYTENDWLNGRIPQGYEIGDRRPHRLKRLPEGDYWLVELESPGYYTAFEPVKITYHGSGSIRIVRVSDVPAEGVLTVYKTDTAGSSLTGAVFEISAYRQPDLTVPIFTRNFSDSGGTAVLSGLPVGDVQKDGSIIPYCYRLKEVVPPEGYALNPQIWSFEFAPDKEGVSYAWGEAAGYEQQITDRKTRITIRKKDFGEAFVSGAELAVYMVEGTNETGGYLYDADTPIDSWITSETEEGHVLEGLAAGRSYLLAELSVPEGYRLMEPVVFTVSADGRRISSIGSQPAAILFRDLYSATIRGRYAVRSEVTVTDQAGERIVSWTASGGGRDLTAADGILDGEIYTLTEKTLYSDGAWEITGRRTRRLNLKNGSCPAEDRRPLRVHLSLRELAGDADGEELASYDPDEEQPELTVGDPASEKELFSSQKRYLLTETTYFNDGSTFANGRMAFETDGDGSVTAITGYDKERQIAVSKLDTVSQKELPGAQLQILDEEGNPLEEWVSGDQPHFLETLLRSGKAYVLRESAPPPGYVRADSITFTVLDDDSVKEVVMTDEPTRVSVMKTDVDGENGLAGAKMQILEQIDAPEGQSQDQVRLIEEWISTEDAHVIEGTLEAGKTYILHEEAAPAGYVRAEDILFTVPLDDGTDGITMKDWKQPEYPDSPYKPGKPARPVTPVMPVKPAAPEDRPLQAEITEATPKVPGTVEAEYQVYLIGNADIPLGSLRYLPVPETGDRNVRMLAAVLLLASSATACVVLWLKIRRKRRDG